MVSHHLDKTDSFSFFSAAHNDFTLHHVSCDNSIKRVEETAEGGVSGGLWQVLLEIYQVGGKCFIILWAWVAAALAEVNYGDGGGEKQEASASTEEEFI